MKTSRKQQTIPFKFQIEINPLNQNNFSLCFILLNFRSYNKSLLTTMCIKDLNSLNIDYCGLTLDFRKYLLMVDMSQKLLLT